MRRGASLIAIAAGLCGIALINRASKTIADSIDQFTDADGRTASLANLIGGGERSDPRTGWGATEIIGAGASQRDMFRTHVDREASK